MCGRVRLSSDVSEIKLVFSIPPHRPTPNFPPSWNAAPTDLLPVVRYDRRAGERSLDLLRCGLIPHWAKDINVGFANINAKAEGIENRPAFREAFQRRRCLVPVDNFYEWKKTPTGKQPYAVALADRGLMALAGLWENWRSPAGEWVRSFAVVTCPPNQLWLSCTTGCLLSLALRLGRHGSGRNPPMHASSRPCSRPIPRRR
jgi:putative SOS response-associated peptidase YedK